jgi:integrase
MQQSDLAASTLKVLIGGRLSPIFDYAIDREWRERANPCRAALKQISDRRTMKPALELQDAPMFLDHCYGVSELLGDFATLLYGTGLRWQEAAVLTAGAINLDRRILRIRQVERAGIEGGKRVATDRGKSDNAFRDVPSPARTTTRSSS